MGSSKSLLIENAVLSIVRAVTLILMGGAWPVLALLCIGLGWTTAATSAVPISCLWVIFSLLGSGLVLEADDMLSMLLGLEIQSYGLYLLGAVVRVQELRAGGSMMYFVTGAVTSCVILLRLALVYSEAGSFQICVFRTGDPVVSGCIGAWVLRIRFLMKLGAAPFWLWAVLVYDAVPAQVGMYIASAPKLALLLKLCSFGSRLSILWSLGAVLSLLVGSLFGLAERRIRRVLALSRVAHVGFALMAAAEGDWQVVEFYGQQYALLTLVAFAVFAIASFGGDLEYQQSSTLAGLKSLSSVHGALALSLATALFSIGGIPPLVGFFAKMVAFLGVLSGSGGLVLAFAL